MYKGVVVHKRYGKLNLGILYANGWVYGIAVAHNSTSRLLNRLRRLVNFAAMRGVFIKISSDRVMEKQALEILDKVYDVVTGKRTNRELFSYLDPSHLNINERRVYLALLQTKRGQTITYGDLARMTRINSPRLIGQILSRNPFPVIIPCHRVIGERSLQGYLGSEYEAKKLLLARER